MKISERILENRNYQFWVVNITGWLGWFTLFSLRDLSHGYGGMLLSLILLADAVAGCLLTVLLRYLYHMVWEKPVVTRVLAVLAGSYVLALLWQLFKNVLSFTLEKEVALEEIIAEWGVTGLFSSHIQLAFFPFLCWSGLYFGIKYYQLLQQEKQKSIIAMGRAQEAQLRMLRYQLNPHFLFNTLNAISTLVLEKDVVNANGMLTRLSRFLRYSLDTDPMEKVDLDREINTIKLYLEIEKVRFEERLRIEFNLDDRAGEALVPSLLLQPLVENSLKYAIAPSEQGGTIRIDARVFGSDLLLDVQDDGPGLEADVERLANGRGVGILNTRQRLRELYGNKHSCSFGPVSPHGLKVSIRIPYQVAVERTAR
jgi:two-component system LytT family sensor kinase